MGKCESINNKEEKEEKKKEEQYNQFYNEELKISLDKSKKIPRQLKLYICKIILKDR